MEEVHIMKFVGKDGKLNDLSLGTTLPSLPDPEAIRILSFGVFIETYLHRHDGLNHWLLAIDSTFSPSPLPERAVGLLVKVLTL